ncbi:MAG: tRNA 2-selenouridine synthase, partial [Limisphaerales bacterium]
MSAPRLHVLEFLSAPGTLVDVRSPSEFEAGHIPGAVNIALFTDEERARVGTLYKKQSREAAIDAGFEIAGPKMKYFADCARKAADDEGLRVYCWRGGMRSGHMSWLFETAGVQTSILEGGYKAYRNTAIEDFTSLPALVVLQGSTGSGKTDILLKMAALGEQVIDLEGLANHRGSAFGALGMDPQPSTE